MTRTRRVASPNARPVPESPAEPEGKVKAMIYVPGEVHTAIRILAARRGCRISDIYAEAAAAYLAAADGPPKRQAQGRETGDAGALMELVAAVERHSALVEEIADKVDCMVPVDPAKVSFPPMTLDTSSWAVASALRMLLNAGEEGMLKAEIAEVGKFQRLNKVVENALYSLKGVGLARNMNMRWWACWPPRQGDTPPFVRGKLAEYAPGKRQPSP